MSLLADRITEVVKEHGHHGGGYCKCGFDWAPNLESLHRHVAAQVAEALQLTEETKPIIDPPVAGLVQSILGYERRWVSEWTAVDLANQPEETS